LLCNFSVDLNLSAFLNPRSSLAVHSRGRDGGLFDLGHLELMVDCLLSESKRSRVDERCVVSVQARRVGAEILIAEDQFALTSNQHIFTNTHCRRETRMHADRSYVSVCVFLPRS
jgi:hypothetical protein